MVWNIITSPLFWAIAGPTFSFILSCIYFKWPSIKAYFKPDEFQQSIIGDRDDLQKEVERLFRLKEALFGEIIVLRKVVVVKSALLDEANAVAARVRGNTRRIEELLHNEQLTQSNPK